MFAARGGWAAIIRPVKRGVGDAAPYMQGEVYYNFVVCNAVRPYRLFYCYSLTLKTTPNPISPERRKCAAVHHNYSLFFIIYSFVYLQFLISNF